MIDKKNSGVRAEKRLVEYIDTLLSNGYKEEIIKEGLIKAGWPKKYIDGIFKKNKLVEKKIAKKSFGKLIFVIIVAIITMIVYLRFLFKNDFLNNLLLYFAFGFILLGLIILLHKLFLYVYVLYGEKRISKEAKAEEIKREDIKEIRINRRKLGIFYFILFLLSIVLFFIAYFYNKMIIIALALISMFVSLLGYGILKIKRTEKISAQGVSKQAQKPVIKKEKIPLVKELSKSLRIELNKYETDLDVLYKIIEQKGRVKLSAIAKYFGVDRKKAEKWATILEEHNMLELHYPAIGEPEVKKKTNNLPTKNQ